MTNPNGGAQDGQAMKRWSVRLICCGRDDGSYECDTWEEASAFRLSYTSGIGVDNGGHDRSAVIEENPPNDPLGAALFAASEYLRENVASFHPVRVQVQDALATWRESHA